MSKISLSPNASGTGTFTIQSPAGNTNRTFTLPDADGELSVGGGGGSNDFVASGSIPNGDAVGLNSDGTVSVIKTPLVDSETIDSSSSFTSTDVKAAINPTTGDIVVVYSDSSNSYQGYAVVGSVNNDTITFGSPVGFQADNDGIGAVATAIGFDSASSKFLIFWAARASYNAGRAVVGTVSGSTISFGSRVNFGGTTVLKDYIDLAFDTNNNKFLVTYDGGDNGYRSATARVATISGTSVSFGSETAIDVNLNNTTTTTCSFDPVSGKFLVYYRRHNAYGRLRVGTISGTSVSFGTEITFGNEAVTTDRVSYFRAASDGTNLVGVYRRDGGAGTRAALFTISGTSVTFGTETTITSSPADTFTLIYNSSLDTFLISGIYTSSIAVKEVKLSNGVFFPKATSTLIDSSTSYHQAVYDPTSGHVISAARGPSNYNPVVSVYNPETNLNNFIGFSEAAISDGDTGSITTLGGINESQTGLIAGFNYYLQDDGSLGSTESDNFAGLAISSTKLIKL